MQSSRSRFNSRVIEVSREVLYDAFLDPEALIVWLPPGDMTGEIHSFDARVGGGYRMSLFYPLGETERKGKTNEREDSVNVRFAELERPVRIVQVVLFDSPDPSFSGEMIMTITF